VNRGDRHVNCAFVVCKLRVLDKDYLLLRYDDDWQDVTWIGGHQSQVDCGDMMRTAIRETEEELPGVKWSRDFSLSPLTSEMSYGPVWSRSARLTTKYRIRFFHLRFRHRPDVLTEALRRDRANRLVSFENLANPENAVVPASDFVGLLDRGFSGGLGAVPYSWNESLSHLSIDASR